jgi:hypothetical protein
MFVLELVLRSARSRVPMLPEGLDEDVPFLVRLELLEDLTLFGRDDIADILFEPEAVLLREAGFAFFLIGEERQAYRGGQKEEDPSMANAHL